MNDLNEQVNRNPDSFPDDFMFQLAREEYSILKSHLAISSWRGRRKLPYAFTEHGVLMLASNPILSKSSALFNEISLIKRQ
jgi:hypothetical protein